MRKIHNITVLGAGNVAWHLTQNLFQQGIVVDFVFSRKMENAKKLADKVNAIACNNIKEITTRSDLYLFVVSDNAIEALSLQLSEKIGKDNYVAHTSGMVSSDIFKPYFNHYGVFYPLQTFTKNRKVEIEEVPFFITANTSQFSNNLEFLANQLSQNVQVLSDEKRKVLHIAAVFSNNFTNFMYSLSKNILENENLDFDYLLPLIKETASKVLDGYNPKEIQTGPAVRNDTNTINKHLEYLKKYPEMKEIYKFITEKIINTKQ